MACCLVKEFLRIVYQASICKLSFPQLGGSHIPISFIGMGMVNTGETIPNPFDFAQGSAALEAATILLSNLTNY
jgi:hypothetical protein